MVKQVALILAAIVLYITSALAQNNAKFSDIIPGMKNGRIERDAIKLANERAGNLRCPEEYSKAKIISYHWIMELDNDGYATGRKIHIELYCEFPDGRCGMADFIFGEKLSGNEEFSDKLQFEKAGDIYTIDCEQNDPPSNPLKWE